jgi:hypothetical protein
MLGFSRHQALAGAGDLALVCDLCAVYICLSQAGWLGSTGGAVAAGGSLLLHRWGRRQGGAAPRASAALVCCAALLSLQCSEVGWDCSASLVT